MMRGVAPVLGVILLVGVTVMLAASVGAASLTMTLPEKPSFTVPNASSSAELPISLTMNVTAKTGRISIVHSGGPEIDVEAITMKITVDEEPLAHQPPVPFFSASGFRSGPSGPFNPAANSSWSEDEEASLRVAGTNDPTITEGVTVVVEIRKDGEPLAKVSGEAT